MNPREFHTLADELLKWNVPAKTRTAISRAYYSAFHVGADTLRQLGFTVSKGGAAHGEVVRCLINSLDQQVATAAKSLGDLHTSRLRADYQLNRVDVEHAGAARQIIDAARQIIETFERVPASPQRTAIQTAIAAWRKSNGYP